MSLDKVIKDLKDMRKAGFIDCNIQCFLSELEKVANNKVTIPQFVADWIDKAKGMKKTLYYALDQSPERVNSWIYEDELNHQETFANAWLNGYRIEKEKKYIVKLNGVSSATSVLKHNLKDDNWYMGIEEEFYALTPCHTKKQLVEAGFAWVFNSPGVEVTEVEEG